MAGPGDPPEGTPEGAAGGGEDEYRSIVFDESFVRAARLQEYSARERMGDHARAVRTRHTWPRAGGPRQALLLVLLIALAFGTAIYMGVRHPYKTPEPVRAEPLRTTVLPLAPTGAVPGATPGDLFAHSPAAEFRVGAAGINLPAAERTDHFSDGQIITALTIAKDYIVRSSIDPATLTHGSVRPVRLLLNTSQLDQFDRSIAHPADDGRHAATGWLVRFDPARTELADPGVRVNGVLGVTETTSNTLEVTADYTFVYAVRAVTGAAAHRDRGPADQGTAGNHAADKSATGDHTTDKNTTGKHASDQNASGDHADSTAAPGTAVRAGEQRAQKPGVASLFTVRRELRFRIGRDDLSDHRLEVLQSNLQAGPLACSSEPADELRPLLAGQRAGDARPAGTDPYARGRTNTALCGELAATAQPTPARPAR
ncbi:hypothetical protein [Streptomyces sp. MST-110588]|uniref:SCO2583 family membrane protein n=1 Tax=Streptomyces sp. MST-110588 TaxID=2833628 RepID=UPI001F5DB0E8|nr:hypothetical protein [Streptomyces sp. MST-110588]UNO42030.1 hypothetical protein KGS77_24025 [Streptomyces sp. MST-110588]